jgi:hypothetical protein
VIPATWSRISANLGPRIQAQSDFNGWGYARLVDTSTPSAPTEVGQITTPEIADPDFHRRLR